MCPVLAPSCEQGEVEGQPPKVGPGDAQHAGRRTMCRTTRETLVWNLQGFPK